MAILYLPYVLHLRAPAVIRNVDRDPSSACSLSYMPGGTIRGAVARGLTDANRDLFSDVILSGKVRYLNAYIYVEDRRTLPTPHSLYVEKNAHEKMVYDAATDPSSTARLESAERFSMRFLTLLGAEPVAITPKLGRRVHHQRDRQAGYAHGKGEKAIGTVFTNEYLQAGQEFCGAIIVQSSSDTESEALIGAVRRALGERILVGRSKRAGYGGDATVRWLSPCSKEVDLSGTLYINPRPRKGSTFRAVLLSHYVGRNPETGQIDPHQFFRDLHTALGGTIRIRDAYSQVDLIGGYNRKWGFETPQVWAMTQGSTAVLEATKDIPEETIRRTMDEGLGERRVEGYGRVAFLELGPPTFPLHDVSAAVIREPGRLPDLAKVIQECTLYEALEKRCIREALSFAERTTRTPTTSLLSRLRIMLGLKPEKALSNLVRILRQDGHPDDEKESLKRPAMKQLQGARVHMVGVDKTLPMREFACKVAQSALQEDDDKTLHRILQLEEVAAKSYVYSREEALKSVDKMLPRAACLFLDCYLSALSRKSANVQKKGGD